MKIYLISILLLLASFNAGFCTETLECESEKYLVRLYVGSTGYFENVLLYETGVEDYLLYPREQLRNLNLDWPKQILKFDYDGKSDNKPSLGVNVDGKETGVLIVNKKEYSLKCYWDPEY